jgi:hypothetical protein
MCRCSFSVALPYWHLRFPASSSMIHSCLFFTLGVVRVHQKKKATCLYEFEKQTFLLVFSLISIHFPNSSPFFLNLNLAIQREEIQVSDSMT